MKRGNSPFRKSKEDNTESEDKAPISPKRLKTGEQKDTKSEDNAPCSPKRLRTGEQNDTTSASAIILTDIEVDKMEDAKEPIMLASKPVRFCNRWCGYGLCHKCYVEMQKKEEGNK
jgi:hypothetical protein